MKNPKTRLVVVSIVSVGLHIAHLKSSVTNIIQQSARMFDHVDTFSILILLTSSVSILSIILGVAGLWIFYKSQEINRWLVAYLIVENFRTVTTVIVMVWFASDFFRPVAEVGYMYYVGLTSMVLTFLGSVNYFSRSGIEKTAVNLKPLDVSSSRSKRLVNYLIDVLLIAGIAFDKFYLLQQTVGFRYVMIGCLVIYYFLSEGLYGRTLGKIFTNTTLRKESGFVSKVLLRTLLRLVPFEQLSFVFGSKPGWHDRFSKTQLYTATRDLR